MNAPSKSFLKMPAALVARTPDNLSDDHVAGVSLTTMVAATALYTDSGHGIQPPWKRVQQHGEFHALVRHIQSRCILWSKVRL
jgi:hypothetical protein